MVTHDKQSVPAQQVVRALASQRKDGKGTRSQSIQFADNRKNPLLTAEMQAIQRRVNSFSSSSIICKTPNQQLKEALPKAQLIDLTNIVPSVAEASINEKLTTTGNVTKVSVVKATLNKNVTNKIGRISTCSQIIGAVGRDEYNLQYNQPMAFEGGHLISHCLWDQNDKDVNHADGFLNLVPMSRTLNMGDYSDNVESCFVTDNYYEHTILCNYLPSYTVPERQIAETFHWPIKDGADPNACFTFIPFIPYRYNHSQRKSPLNGSLSPFITYSGASESEQVKPIESLIDTKAKLIAILQQKGLFNYLSQDMIDALSQ